MRNTSSALSAQAYGLPAGTEFFGAQTRLIARLVQHFPNKMAISRLLSSGKLKSVGKNGALAFKTEEFDALIAEKRREVVSAVMSKGAEERQRIITELAEGHAASRYQATPDHLDKAKAEQQVAKMIAEKRTGTTTAGGQIRVRANMRAQMRLY